MDERQRSVSEGIRYPVNSTTHTLFPSKSTTPESPVHTPYNRYPVINVPNAMFASEVFCVQAY